jgi:hypothetical protein
LEVARINVESTLWQDKRFQKLLIRVGDRHKAMGLVIDLWTLAQQYWLPDKKLIPECEFDPADLDHLLAVGLVEQRPEGVYAKGSKDHFSWWFEGIEQRREAGRKSAETRRQRYGNAAPAGAKNAPKLAENPRTGSERPFNGTERTSNALEPSSSSSFSVNTKDEESIGSLPANAGANPPAEKPAGRFSQENRAKAREFAAAYVRAYQVRFPGCRPEDLNDDKVRGQILTWIKNYPLERARQLIQVYFQMDTKWFGTKGYDFTTFRNNLNKIGQALDTGQDPDGNKVDWAKVFGGAA